MSERGGQLVYKIPIVALSLGLAKISCIQGVSQQRTKGSKMDLNLGSLLIILISSAQRFLSTLVN